MRHFFYLFTLVVINCSLQAQELPTDFYDTKIQGGFELATGITFDELGRGYIWEKSGIVYVLDTTGQVLSEPLIDLREEVANWDDHGLNYMCLDKDFLENGRFYLYYVLDLHHYYYYGTPDYQADSTIVEHATVGRVTRYEADLNAESPRAIPASRQVLLGDDITNSVPILYPFHGLGTIAHAEDGTLLISCGDANPNLGIITGNDPDDPYIPQAINAGILTPDQDIGSYKAQYIGSYSGKVLRIDAETGNGLESNPYFDSDKPRSARSRIWNMGLRNPYRFTFRPNTGSHSAAEGNPGTMYIGDVGNGGWEELSISKTGGQNFGWPVYEGLSFAWNFWTIDAPINPLAPNPISNCEQEFFNFRHLLAKSHENGAYLPANPCDNTQVIPENVFPQYAEPPVLVWNNSKWNPPVRTYVPMWRADNSLGEISIGEQGSGVTGETFEGYSSLSGVFYEGNSFPEEYAGKFFSIDFSGWIKVMDFDENDALKSVDLFHNNATNIIHLAQNNWDGSLYYTNLEGEVRKISFGGNPAPIAVIEADQSYGTGTLNVNFTAAQSYDPNQNDLTYEWDFGDGETANGENVSHLFSTTGSTPKSYVVLLTVIDELGAVGYAEKVISLNNSPPIVAISSFKDGDQYPLNATSLLVLDAQVQDAEHGEEELFYEWRVYLHHNYHFHPKPVDFEHKTHTLISPLGCENEDYHYRIELTVTDPEGLQGFDSKAVYPYCDDPFIEWVNLSLTPNDKGVQLDWGAVMEDEIAHFEIQRSPDFYNFQTIATVHPTGNNSAYTYFDEAPPRGGLVYRIKVITTDRAYAYSNMEATSFPKPGEWKIFPNPAGNSFTISVEEAKANTIELELFNTFGQHLRRSTFAAEEGEVWSQFILSSILPKGMYWYKIINGDQTYVGQLLLQ